MHGPLSPDAADPMGERPATVVGLVGVYDADGSPRGEIAYWIGARLGRAHCALCDVTHGTFRERPDWRVARDALPVAFTTCHRDDCPDDVAACTDGRLPAVVARTGSGVVLLLGPDDLDACQGAPDRLVAELHRSVAGAGLVWATLA